MAQLLELLAVFRLLLSNCDPGTHIHMLRLLVPVLISVLSRGAAAHKTALGEITALTQSYPGEVRTLFAEDPALKQQLEGAIRAAAAAAATKNSHLVRQSASSASSAPAAAPSIALKMDFSNFK